MTTPENYQDTFKPRRFQDELIKVIEQRHDAGERVTVAIASPGSGKTLAYQAAATHLMRREAITHVVVFVPRVTLARQCELKWRNEADGYEAGDFELFDNPRLQSILHRENKPPFTSPGATNVGYVTTYSSLVTNPRLHRQWAENHRGRFLLVGDEAQFLGASVDDGGDGPKSADYFAELSKLAAHTLLLTGTEHRADGLPLILSRYESGEDGRDHLQAHVRARYSDGIADGYLRAFDARLTDFTVERTDLQTEETRTELLSRDAGQLGQVLGEESVWTQVADATVEQLRRARSTHSGYKALIACQKQSDARAVAAYLRRSGVRAAIAVSDDGVDASTTLDAFKFDDTEVLVTVRMAFLGYDCESITVVGLLTNYRDPGHLEQLIGRGLRVWSEAGPADQQVCRIVAPNDPAMVRFLDGLRREQDRGLARRTPSDAHRGGGGPIDPTALVNGAVVHSQTALGHDGDVGADQLAILDALGQDFPEIAAMPSGRQKQLLQRAQGNAVPADTYRPTKPRQTVAQQIDAWVSSADKIVKRATNQCVSYSEDPRAWQDQKRRMSYSLADRVGIRDAKSITTLAQAKAYFAAAQDILREVAV